MERGREYGPGAVTISMVPLKKVVQAIALATD
jgi:hypothetical protein